MSTDTTATPSKTEESDERVALSQIDRSLRFAGLFFLISASIWLMIGTVFAVIASYKLHTPDFLAEYECLTFGRVRAAQLSVFIYGWANNAIFCVALWLMARLSRGVIRHGGLLLIAGLFWNFGVTLGVAGILSGNMTSVEWLDFPKEVAPILVISYGLIAMWGIAVFASRKVKHVFVSQWFILAALFWFPWAYIIAQVMILYVPARGVVQSITNGWFANHLFVFWLTPMALAVSFYLIPKVLGKPVYSYYLSMLGFWTLAIFCGWAGVQSIIAGPVPLWLQSASIVSSVLIAMPVLVIAINLHMTTVGGFGYVWRSPTLRFVVFGAMSFVIVNIMGIAMAIKPINEVVQFSYFNIAHTQLEIYGFFTMVMFGAIYFIVPRFLQREWPSAAMIRVHWWACALGVVAYVVALSLGGWIQGMEMKNPEILFSDVMNHTIPWLAMRTIAEILLTIGHAAFFINFFWMLFSKSTSEQPEPTLLDSE